MHVGFHFARRSFCQCCGHVRGFDKSLLKIALVDRMNLIDKRQVPSIGGIEVMTEAAVDEDVDDVGKADEQLKVKPPYQQRQYVLRSDAFEPLL